MNGAGWPRAENLRLFQAASGCLEDLVHQISQYDKQPSQSQSPADLQARPSEPQDHLPLDPGRGR